MMTVAMAVMRGSALRSHATPVSSSATIACASRRFGSVTNSLIVRTSQMSPWRSADTNSNHRSQAPVQHTSSSVAMGNVSIWTGNAMETRTAKTNQMNKIVVSVQNFELSLEKGVHPSQLILMRRPLYFNSVWESSELQNLRTSLILQEVITPPLRCRIWLVRSLFPIAQINDKII